MTIRPRDLLGRFLFSGDDIDKPVSVLSGGERTRLALAKLLVTPVNFLCMDEPTNHLDVESRDVLEDALVEYTGTIVLITHDRHLIRSVANKILEVNAGVVRSYLGDYDDYLWRKQQESEPVVVTASAQPKARSKADKAAMRKLRADVRRVEAELDKAVAERADIEARLSDPKAYTPDDAKAHAIAAKRVAELESQWEMLTETLEGAG